MKKSIFSMDALGKFSLEGWSDGTMWNGWDKPVFDFDEAQRLIDVFVKAHRHRGEQVQAWYDERQDSFCFVLPNESEPECYSAEIIEIYDGHRLKVYPIGTGAWVWEELSI